MKKFTSLLIGCAFALAGAALAQQPEEQQSPTKGKHAMEKTQTVEPQPGAKAARPEAPMPKQHGMKNEGATSKGRMPETMPKSEMMPKTEKPSGTEPNVSGQPAINATPLGRHEAGQRGKGKNARSENVRTSPNAAPATSAAASAAPAPSAAASTTPAVTASVSAAPSVAATSPQNAGAKAKKPDQQKVEQIKTQHATFKAQPKPDKIPAVTFSQSYRIEGSDRWQGPQYEVFRSYHPERHDERWYHSRYTRVELIGGGYYYFNSGYWYPAWGYSPAAEYYVYDGPIYVGHRSEPPDRVIADVQAELQEMGYYRGEVDGLLGPLTREALTAYQSDQGLTATAVIDEPTLDALGMG